MRVHSFILAALTVLLRIVTAVPQQIHLGISSIQSQEPSRKSHEHGPRLTTTRCYTGTAATLTTQPTSTAWLTLYTPCTEISTRILETKSTPPVSTLTSAKIVTSTSVGATTTDTAVIVVRFFSNLACYLLTKLNADNGDRNRYHNDD